MSSKFDPLEEAKITDDKSEDKGLSKKKQKAAAKAAKAEAASEAPAAPAAPEAPPAPPLPPTPAERAARKPVVIKPAAEAKMVAAPGKKYRVLEDRMASIRGRMTKLRTGKVLEARFYGGVLNLQRILDSGVKVEEC